MFESPGDVELNADELSALRAMDRASTSEVSASWEDEAEAVPGWLSEHVDPTWLSTRAPDAATVEELERFDVENADTYDLLEVMAAWDHVASKASGMVREIASHIATRPEMRMDTSQLKKTGKLDPLMGGEEVAMRLGCSKQRGRKLVAAGHALRAACIPTADALAAGEIDVIKADMITSAVAHLPGELALAVQDRVLPRAGLRSHYLLGQDLAKAVADVDTADFNERCHVAATKRRVDHPRPLGDGLCSIYAVLPTLDAAAIDTTLDAAARSAQAGGDTRTLAQLRADVLATLTHSALATGWVGGPPGGNAPPTVREGTPNGATTPAAVATASDDGVRSGPCGAIDGSSCRPHTGASFFRPPAVTPNPPCTAPPLPLGVVTVFDVTDRLATRALPDRSALLTTARLLDAAERHQRAAWVEHGTPTSGEHGTPSVLDEVPTATSTGTASRRQLLLYGPTAPCSRAIPAPPPGASRPGAHPAHPRGTAAPAPAGQVRVEGDADPSCTAPPTHGSRPLGAADPPIFPPIPGDPDRYRVGTLGGRRAQIDVTVPLSTLQGGDEPAEITGLGPIDADSARAYAARTLWRRLVTDPLSGTVLDVGTARYRPPPAMAEHVRRRDQHCIAPGCGGRAEACDVDHTIPHPHGPTAVWNLDLLCRRHHVLKTHGGFHVIQPTPGTFVWTTPTGQRYRRNPDGTTVRLARDGSESGAADCGVAPMGDVATGDAASGSAATRTSENAGGAVRDDGPPPF